jgi:RpiR family transcriptional regulator, carbohydrate utilization regulator
VNENLLSLTRIRQHYSMLSNAERKIADYILDNYKDIASSTAEKLADFTGTSPATIIRFCRSLGFKGLADFKLYLNHEFLSPSTKWLNVETDESIASIKQKTFGFNKSSIDETLSLLDNDCLEAAVDAIDKASQVAIVAVGGSASTARCAYDAFLQIGISCVFLEDPFFQVLGLWRLPKDTVVIGFCHSGQAKDTVDAVKVAKEMGFKTIGLVGIVGSPMMKYLDIALLTGVSEHPFFSDSIAARICELNVISAVHAALSIRRREKLGDYSQEVSDLLSIKRIKK